MAVRSFFSRVVSFAKPGTGGVYEAVKGRRISEAEPQSPALPGLMQIAFRERAIHLALPHIRVERGWRARVIHHRLGFYGHIITRIGFGRRIETFSPYQ